MLAPFLGAHTANGIARCKSLRHKLAGSAADVHKAAGHPLTGSAEQCVLPLALAGEHIDAQARGMLYAGKKVRPVARIPHGACGVCIGDEPILARGFRKGYNSGDTARHRGLRKHAGRNEPFSQPRCDKLLVRILSQKADGIAADVNHGNPLFFHR